MPVEGMDKMQYNTHVYLFKEPPSITKISLTGHRPVVKRVS